MSAKPLRGKLRIRRDLRRLGLGWLQISAHTRDKRKFEQRNAVVTKLIDDGQIQVLAALKDGHVSIEQLVELDRRNQMTGANVLGEIAMRAPLFATWEAKADEMGKSHEGRKRYEVTRRQLLAAWGASAETMTVKDLVAVNWLQMAADWPRSASDWNHVRRAISHLLSLILGSKHHPLRHEIMAKIPQRPEHERTPDVTPETFWRVATHLRADIRPVFVTLAATGLRIRSEFLLLQESDLLPATHQIRVPGDLVTRPRYVSVAPDQWSWIAAAVPSPMQYKWLRLHWKRACEAAGVSGVTIHDLRHCHAQWATDGGAQLTQVQVQLGHANPSTTGRYARTRDARSVAEKVGRAMTRPAE